MDIIVDLETLGTDVDSTVIQIACSAFSFKTGNLLGEPFVGYLALDTMKQEDIKASGSTLKWWMTQNRDVFESIINNPFRMTHDGLWEAFFNWLSERMMECRDKGEELKIWGNGISFDCAMVKHNLGERYDAVIHFWNERDARTLVDMHCRSMGYSDRNFKKQFDREGKHDAMVDIAIEAEYLAFAYNNRGVN